MQRTAVVVMNLGGPDSLAAVRPFLFNLFSDPAIIRLPGLMRIPLAWLIGLQRAGLRLGIGKEGRWAAEMVINPTGRGSPPPGDQDRKSGG